MISTNNNFFQVLFQFRNKEQVYFETKRLDLPEERPPAERFQWFCYKQKPDRLNALHFEGMGRDETRQWRQFSEGKLVFDSQGATFTPKGDEHREVELEASNESLLDHLQQRLLAFFGF